MASDSNFIFLLFWRRPAQQIILDIFMAKASLKTLTLTGHFQSK